MHLIVLLTFTLLISSSCICFGGWFGPDNFEECVLENMKGQDKFLISMARKNCEKQFPYEKELNLDEENIKVSWSNEGGYLSLAIEKRSNVYILTRVDALFSKKKFADINNESDYSLLKTFVFSPDPKVAGTAVDADDAESYKTMIVKKAWGIMKKQ